MKGFGLIISETPSSTFSYHLRALDESGPKYGGISDGKALCGAKVGWDTKFRLGGWGIVGHLHERWCSSCFELAKRQLDDLVDDGRASGLCVCEICNKEYRLHPDAYFDYEGNPFLTRLCDGRVVKL